MPMRSARVERLRERSKAIALAACAAGIAWLIAHDLVGHPAPFFAPVAAITVIGLTVGQRLSRAVELTIGQAVGILIADALVGGLGTGAVSVTLVSALAMTAAVLIGSGTMIVQQAAVSGVLVATIQPPGSGLSSGRFVDALIGGGVAIVLNTMVFPTNPLALARRRAGPLLHELAATLDAVADALRRADLDAADAALERARGLDELATRFAAAARAGREAQRYAPIHRGAREAVAAQVVAAGRIDLAVRNVRVLARRARRAVARGDDVPDTVVEAIYELARGVQEVEQALSQDGGAHLAETHALSAARLATEALDRRPSLSVTVLVAQVRSTVQDLLQAIGFGESQALRAIDGEEAASTSIPAPRSTLEDSSER